MNLNACLSLGCQLAEAYRVLEALIAAGQPAPMIASASKRCSVLSADILAAKEEQQKFSAWTPHNPRNAS